MMYIGLYFLFLIFNFRGPLVYQFYYCYMLPSLNKVLLTYLHREVKRMKETVGHTDRQTKMKLTYERLVAWTLSVRGLNATIATYKLAKLRTLARASRNKYARTFKNGL